MRSGVDSSQVPHHQAAQWPVPTVPSAQCPAKQSTPPAHLAAHHRHRTRMEKTFFTRTPAAHLGRRGRTGVQVSILIPSSRLSRRNPTLLTSSSPHPVNEQGRRGLATRNMRDDYSKWLDRSSPAPWIWIGSIPRQRQREQRTGEWACATESSTTIEACEPLISREFLTIIRYRRRPVSREAPLKVSAEAEKNQWLEGLHCCNLPFFHPVNECATPTEYARCMHMHMRMHEGFSFDEVENCVIRMSWQNRGESCARSDLRIRCITPSQLSQAGRHPFDRRLAQAEVSAPH